MLFVDRMKYLSSAAFAALIALQSVDAGIFAPSVKYEIYNAPFVAGNEATVEFCWNESKYASHTYRLPPGNLLPTRINGT
jgi:hypothetical protein